jgi:hypothetical protein
MKDRYEEHPGTLREFEVEGHRDPCLLQDVMTRAPLTAAAARSIVVEICHLAIDRPVTSVIICDHRALARRALAQMLHPLGSLKEIICVSDGFLLVDAYCRRPVDIVLIGVDRFGDCGGEAIVLQLAMHPHSVIITVGAASDADLLVAATMKGARGLLIWDHDEVPPVDPNTATYQCPVE